MRDLPQEHLKGSTYSKHLSYKVRTLRRMRRWSQASLAAQAGITQAAVAKIENGQANPTLKTIEQLATALDVHLVELLGP
jgi:transcriptional regulator with XRE-family HTH domain